MMYEVVGIEKLNYYSKKSQRQVTGTKLYLTYADNRIEGKGVKDLYAPGDMAAAAIVGDTIKAHYNERGQLSEIVII